MLDFNQGSGYQPFHELPIGHAINARIDESLIKLHRQETRRGYLGGSRIGEACARMLYYEYSGSKAKPGAWMSFYDDYHDAPFDGRTLRIFRMGHIFEDMTIKLLLDAGFLVSTRNSKGQQHGFVTAGGKFSGHIDGCIVSGPEPRLAYPALFEHKSLNDKSWNKIVKKGVREAAPVYYAQCVIYMAYMELPSCLFTAMNKNTCELFHEIVEPNPSYAQELSDKAVMIIRAAEIGQPPPRIAANRDFYICKSLCAYSDECWKDAR